jgi:hypothetical protein
MSIVASPSTHRSRGRTYGIAATCRARHLVATLGGRFSLELGIDVGTGADEIERWALAATLFGNRISTSVALRTYRVLERAGIRTIADAGARDRKELVALLDEGGYARYDERTASRLVALADTIAHRYNGRLSMIGERLVDADELQRVLPLSSLAAVAHLDLTDLEAGLVRLGLCHDLADCPGGEECPFAAFDREQFVHF